VSLANEIALQQERQSSKSFVYIINIECPKTDPWRSPHEVMVVADLMLLYCRYCFLLLR